MGVLRLFLALAVVNVHGGQLLGFPLLKSTFAVQAFYMISGFYMALVLHEKYQPGKATYFEFIANRFLRIFPCYFLVLLLTILLLLSAGFYYGKNLGPIALWAENWAHFDWTTKFFMVLSHLTLFGQDAYLFLGLNELGALQFDPDFRGNHNVFWKVMFIPPSWSLSIELYFYLLAPFLVRRSVAVLALIIASSITVRFVLALWLGWTDDPWSYRFFPSELALFMCGAAAYRIYRVVRIGEMDVRAWFGWGALGVAAAAALLVNRFPGEMVIWLNICFVVAVLLILPFLFKLTQHSKIDRHLGELSFPLYLCHVLVISLFNLMGVPEGAGRNIGILLVALLLSAALYWWVDRKVDNYRHNMIKGKVESPAGAGA